MPELRSRDGQRPAEGSLELAEKDFLFRQPRMDLVDNFLGEKAKLEQSVILLQSRDGKKNSQERRKKTKLGAPPGHRRASQYRGGLPRDNQHQGERREDAKGPPGPPCDPFRGQIPPLHL